jgi:hypothetical protein
LFFYARCAGAIIKGSNPDENAGLLGITGFVCGVPYISIINVEVNYHINDGSKRDKKLLDL